MPAKALVPDANILIRSVLGRRVRGFREAHAETISFFLPETRNPLESRPLRGVRTMC